MNDPQATGTDRPYNDLLGWLKRRRRGADRAAAHAEAAAGEPLYNPGDNVDTVHLACRPSLAFGLVANELGT